MNYFGFLLVLTGGVLQLHANISFINNTIVQAETLNGHSCEEATTSSGVIQFSGKKEQCWNLNVPENSYIQLDFLNNQFQQCYWSRLDITLTGTNESYQVCYEKPLRKLVSFSSVHLRLRTNGQYSANFKVQYTIESIICKRSNHFRCSNSSCIRKDQVCDGKVDCEDGSDEKGCETRIAALDDERLISWLKHQRDPSLSWGKNTPRAIIALYLSGNVSFRGNNMEEEVMVKDLELQMSKALLRNYTEQISVNELSMFINALKVACYDPHRIFGHDLLQILSDRMSPTSPIPGPYLTLCSSNWSVHQNTTKSLLDLLQTESTDPFATDLQAITLIALTCIKDRTSHFDELDHSEVYKKTIHKFMDQQHSDGSFGNPQTTAWVAQALIASGKQNNSDWNFHATVDYLRRELKSSEDFILTYLTLPILKGRSLLDIRNANCTGVNRKHKEDIDDLNQKLDGDLKIEYSLYLGDNKNIKHTMHLRMPHHSSVYDVMKAAQMADKKYRFSSKTVSHYRYVYEVAGVSNDPEAGMFWLIYRKSEDSDEMVRIRESPDNISVENEDHLILWYRTSNI